MTGHDNITSNWWVFLHVLTSPWPGVGPAAPPARPQASNTGALPGARHCQVPHHLAHEASYCSIYSMLNSGVLYRIEPRPVIIGEGLCLAVDGPECWVVVSGLLAAAAAILQREREREKQETC